jgi:hypothetical protein
MIRFIKGNPKQNCSFDSAVFPQIVIFNGKVFNFIIAGTITLISVSSAKTGVVFISPNHTVFSETLEAK